MIARLLALALLLAPALALTPAAALAGAPAPAREAPAALASAAPAPSALAAPAGQRHEWPFATSDLPVDPAYRFGRLDNGMRYIIRPNATPAGQGSVQFWVDAGSLSESDDERGYAHFVEHMAFNGSTNVPEGEMVRLLEREGLAFGADTNASTGFDTTLYKLDLPRNDPALLDTALMLMRETASELTFAPEAVERERGVILAERRVRDTYSLRNTVAELGFLYPGARLVERLPIGTIEALRAATAESLRAFWNRVYRPANTALIVVGEFDPDMVEQAIVERFGDWEPAPLPPRGDPGPIPYDHAGATTIYLDPALSERITVARHGPWLDQTDTLAFRQANVRREIGRAVINRRMQRLAHAADPPFRGAGLGTSEVFESGRTTQLVVNAGEGEWAKALAAAQAEYRRALELGFTEAEVAEQVANLRTALENNAAGAGTRSNAAFVTAALTLLDNRQIPTTPASALERFEQHLPAITPETVLAALKEELVPLDNPLIRFEGRTLPEGGEQALRAAWDEGMTRELTPDDEAALADFAYTDFGPAGLVVSDTTLPGLDIRQITFDNGLRLSLKPTDLQLGRVSVHLSIDGGQMLNTRDDPLATAMVGVLPAGGLGRHSFDELQSITAGRSVGFSVAAAAETFRMTATTTPRDLELQLQMLAAAITDPGYRPQGEAQYRRSIRNSFARRTATPESALANAVGGIISDDDPRFTLQPEEAYLALDFETLRAAISDRFERGAMELALVGDFDESEAIGLVAATLGALPEREAEFRDYADNRDRIFTADRSLRVVRHDGAPDQALIRMSWPTRDDSDLEQALRLQLLGRVMRIRLTDELREELGQTYSPQVSAAQSNVYPGYGVFSIAAAVDIGDIDATREAMLEALHGLAAAPVDADVLQRARQPLLENYDNALKTNAGWMNLVRRAQTEPERIERFRQSKDLVAAITAEDLQAIAARYLRPDERLEFLVLPRDEPGGVQAHRGHGLQR